MPSVPTDAAGAIVDNETLKNYHKSDLNIDLYLSNNDSYSFFEKTKSLVQVGATGTNVADVQITIIK